MSSSLESLSTAQAHSVRTNTESFDAALRIFKSSEFKKLGDKTPGFLEQLTLSAIDVGRLDIADSALQLLNNIFPDSSRVAVLTGIRLEATASPDIALRYYDSLLAEDESHQGAWKRKISILRRIGQTDKAVEELVTYLDTFYLDPEGWLELADIYSFLNQYTSALSALSQLLIISPQNPFHTLQFAETAYTSGDIALAIRMFLLVVDMCTPKDKPELKDERPTGVIVRAWFGLKSCTRNLSLPSSPSGTPPITGKHLKLLDELATERILRAYDSGGVLGDGGGGKEARAVVQKWLGKAI